MRGILEPEPILDQPQPTGLTYQGVEDLLQAFRPQPLAKVGQQGVVRQGTFQADLQEEAEGDVEADRGDDLAIREPVLTGEQFQLQHEDAIQGRAAETRVSGFQNQPKALEVNDVQPGAENGSRARFLRTTGVRQPSAVSVRWTLTSAEASLNQASL